MAAQGRSRKETNRRLRRCHRRRTTTCRHRARRRDRRLPLPWSRISLVQSTRCRRRCRRLRPPSPPPPPEGCATSPPPPRTLLFLPSLPFPFPFLGYPFPYFFPTYPVSPAFSLHANPFPDLPTPGQSSSRFLPQPPQNPDSPQPPSSPSPARESPNAGSCTPYNSILTLGLPPILRRFSLSLRLPTPAGKVNRPHPSISFPHHCPPPANSQIPSQPTDSQLLCSQPAIPQKLPPHSNSCSIFREFKIWNRLGSPRLARFPHHPTSDPIGFAAGYDRKSSSYLPLLSIPPTFAERLPICVLPSLAGHVPNPLSSDPKSYPTPGVRSFPLQPTVLTVDSSSSTDLHRPAEPLCPPTSRHRDSPAPPLADLLENSTRNQAAGRPDIIPDPPLESRACASVVISRHEAPSLPAPGQLAGLVFVIPPTRRGLTRGRNPAATSLPSVRLTSADRLFRARETSIFTIDRARAPQVRHTFPFTLRWSLYFFQYLPHRLRRHRDLVQVECLDDLIGFRSWSNPSG